MVWPTLGSRTAKEQEQEQVSQWLAGTPLYETPLIVR